jgi:MazG family protein
VEEVAEGIRRKLVARHPHVFGDEQAGSADEVKHSWERRKHDEKGRDSLMDGIPEGMPAVTRAAKVQHRAAAVGFDWPEAEPVLDKILEEVGELRADLTDPERRGEELGDLLFSVVNLARHLDVEPETALRRATDRFTARFRAMEHAAGRPLQDLSLDELEALWQAAKRLPPPASGSGAGAGAL